MTDTVPFDPPYVKKIAGQDGDRWVEVRIDGSEAPCDAPSQWPLQATNSTASSANAPTARASKFTMLKVPYAEKDEAKCLGAKWDAARKKWYVPAGVDAELFSRWIDGN